MGEENFSQYFFFTRFEITPFEAILSIIITWIVGLIPPFVIRYKIFKKSLPAWSALAVSTTFYFFNMNLFISLGSKSKTHASLMLIAIISYRILRKPTTKDEEAKLQKNINNELPSMITSLMGAAMLGKIKQMESLITNGVDIDAKDDREWTALMYAASRDEQEAIEWLLQQGANPDIRNKENQTALDIAKNNNHLEVAATLLQQCSSEF